MPVNDLTFNQLSTVLNAINAQATGTQTIAPVNTSEFVSVGQTLLKTGYDPLNTAISQVLSRTIFANRPYSAKFRGLQVSNQRYGAITRKLSPVDKPFEDDSRFALVDGQAVDHYVVNKPKVLQENFYGANVFEKSLTVYKDQLDNAFSGVDQFAQFVSMMMTNANDMIEQAHESTARYTINNLMAGIIDANNAPQVVHLVREYNTATGSALTSETVFAPDNFDTFVKWAYARVETVSNMLTERSAIYHLNTANNVVMRHTPQRTQKVYLSAMPQSQIASRVLADAYHDNYLKYADHESVNFWQSISDPNSINITPVYLDTANGGLKTGDTVNQANIFGMIFDEEAAGYTVVNQWAATTPLNAKGGYTNYFWHFTDKYWNSFTENAVVFLLD